QNELSRPACRRDAGATIFSHVHGDTEVHGETKCLRESSGLRCLRGERRRGRLVTPFLLLLLTGTGCGSRKTEEPAKTAEPVPPPPIAKPSYEGINVTNGGAISGVVRFTGTKPKLQPRPVTKNSEICGQVTKPGVIHLQCDAGHTWMSGYIVVVEHPYHTTTGNRGTFALADVPPGSYRVKAWHERFGTLEQEVSVAPGSESRISFDYQTP